MVGSTVDITVPVLDDTSSTYLSLIETTDFAHMRLNPDDQYFQGSVTLTTANGHSVFNSLLLVEAQLVGPDGNLLGPMVLTRAINMPQQLGQAPYGNRVSGTFLRHILFSATAPDSQGRLFFSAKRAVLRLHFLLFKKKNL